MITMPRDEYGFNDTILDIITLRIKGSPSPNSHLPQIKANLFENPRIVFALKNYNFPMAYQFYLNFKCLRTNKDPNLVKSSFEINSYLFL